MTSRTPGTGQRQSVERWPWSKAILGAVVLTVIGFAVMVLWFAAFAPINVVQAHRWDVGYAVQFVAIMHTATVFLTAVLLTLADRLTKPDATWLQTWLLDGASALLGSLLGYLAMLVPVSLRYLMLALAPQYVMFGVMWICIVLVASIVTRRYLVRRPSFR